MKVFALFLTVCVVCAIRSVKIHKSLVSADEESKFFQNLTNAFSGIDGNLKMVQNVSNGVDMSGLTAVDADLTGEVDDLTGEVARLTIELNTSKVQVADLTGEVDDLTGEVDDLTDEVFDLTGEVAGLTIELNTSKVQVADLTGEVDDLTDEVFLLRQNLTFLANLTAISLFQLSNRLINDLDELIAINEIIGLQNSVDSGTRFNGDPSSNSGSVLEEFCSFEFIGQFCQTN